MFKQVTHVVSSDYNKYIDGVYLDITHKREDIASAQRNIDNSKNHLEQIRIELVKVLNQRLNVMKSKRFTNLNEFLNPIKSTPELAMTSLSKDYLYMLYDSLGKPKILRLTNVIVVYQWKERQSNNANYIEHEEGDLRRDINTMTQRSYNWRVDIDRADTPFIAKHDKVLLIPELQYMINDRGTHSKMKNQNVLVFKRSEETEELFNLRDAIDRIKGARDE